MVFIRDPCGIVCLIFTYGAVIYADYVVMRWIILTTMPLRWVRFLFCDDDNIHTFNMLVIASGRPFTLCSLTRSSSCLACRIWRLFSQTRVLCRCPPIAWTSPIYIPQTTVQNRYPAMAMAANGLCAPVARPTGHHVPIIVAYASAAYAAWTIIVRG